MIKQLAIAVCCWYSGH